MLLDQKITDIMTRRVVRMDTEEKVADAVALMDREEVRKVLLVENGKPSGVLEKWMASKMNRTKTINSAFKELELAPQPVRVVSKDFTLAEADEALGSYAALVVVENPRTPQPILGIVTTSDLYKAKPKF